MAAPEVLPNGFVKVDGFYVQGVQALLARRVNTADDSRVSCTCAEGHKREWCTHRKAAYATCVAAVTADPSEW